MLFFTDAKAMETGAWIGGFRQDAAGHLVEWCSEEVDPGWAEWMSYKTDPKRVIATLELLASLVAVKLWLPTGKRLVNASCRLRG